MNAIEPIADVVTGGIAARAVEPDTGVDATGHTEERNCLNCGTALVGSFCHACGQKGHVHRSLAAFGHDLLHGVFHFEGKIWKTIPMLAFKPGALTRRYIAGERASFVSPLALFLFCVFLLFATLGATAALDFKTAGIDQQLKQGVEGDRKTLEQLQARRAAAAAAGQPITSIDKQIRDKRDDIALAEKVVSDGVITDQSTITSEVRGIEDAYRAAKKNPDLLIYKLKSNGYKYSWALIPLSLPLMWLLFPFSRRFRMHDHAVFVTYSLCFMTLLAVLGSLLAAAKFGGTGLLVFIAPIHMVAQLKGAYRLSWWSTAWRSIPLLAGTLLIAILFAVTILVLGVYD